MDMLRFSDRFQAVLSLFSPQIGWIITVVKWVGMLRFIHLVALFQDADFDYEVNMTNQIDARAEHVVHLLLFTGFFHKACSIPVCLSEEKVRA